MGPWPPPKELKARKCLWEGKNFASGGRRVVRWRWLPWRTGQASVRLGVSGRPPGTGLWEAPEAGRGWLMLVMLWVRRREL